MVKLQLFKVVSDTFPVGGRGTGDEAAGSVENKDHLSPQLKLQLGLGWAWQQSSNMQKISAKFVEKWLHTFHLMQKISAKFVEKYIKIN